MLLSATTVVVQTILPQPLGFNVETEVRSGIGGGIANNLAGKCRLTTVDTSSSLKKYYIRPRSLFKGLEDLLLGDTGKRH